MKPWWSFVLFCLVLKAHATEPTGHYLKTIERMRKLAATAPEITRVFSIGNNDEGTPIFALRVSFRPERITREKLGYLVVAAHHGNEDTTPDAVVAFAESLVAKFRSRELFDKNLADTEWTLIPVLNIPGYNGNSRLEHERDPNRDYPGPCESRDKGRLASVRAMMALLERRSFVGSITVHGYTGSLSYPWGVRGNESRTHDDSAYARVVQLAAELSGYRYGNSTTTVYAANGTFEDFVYWKYGTWSLLLELKDGSHKDISATVPSMHAFFDGIDRHLSSQHDYAGECLRGKDGGLELE